MNMVTSKNSRGSALVVALIIMALLAAAIMGLMSNVETDFFIGRNVRVLKQAFQWSDSGMEAAEEMIAFSIDERGVDAFNSSGQRTINGRKYNIINPGDAIYVSDNSTVILEVDDTEVARVDIQHLGSILGDGSSIIMAAGFQGVGKGAGSGGTLMTFFALQSRGTTEGGDPALKDSAQVYRFLSR
jgi:Tfp pilus assembly protein PilX